MIPAVIILRDSFKRHHTHGADYPHRLTRRLHTRIEGAAWLPKEPLHCIAQGKHWATLHRTGIDIEPSYAIDGATGAPDYKNAMLGAFLHDLLYQFGKCPNAPYTRAQADDLFYGALLSQNFHLPRTYHTAVRLLGWLHYKPHPDTYLLTPP
jgi:hypothetical protein